MVTAEHCVGFLRRCFTPRQDCQYFSFNEPHMGLEGRAFQASVLIEDMVFLGDTRSAEELAVYTNMAPERLCLGCGLRVEEKFTPISPGERGRLFAASVKLLQFALRAVSASASEKELTEEEGALLRAIRPLVKNTDCHFLAALTALVQSILEGRTDCPISGVFGAGKTRAAAAMIGGLLVMDPTLKVMVVTKENAAAHAFTKHFESLQLPPSIEGKVGWLVGATELEKGPASKTDLDVPPAFRNDVLRKTSDHWLWRRLPSGMLAAIQSSFQMDGGCGCCPQWWRTTIWESGWVLSHCTSSPQRTCHLVWGSQANTRGTTQEWRSQGVSTQADAKAHSREGGHQVHLTTYAGRYSPSVCARCAWTPSCWSAAVAPRKHPTTPRPVLYECNCLTGVVSCAALAVLWLALAPEKFPLQADTFCSAAGTAGKQKWALILPSSARVSELTYATIVGTRHPELDTIQKDTIQFGNYLHGEQSTRGGFLPIFWDAPDSYIHASTDIGEVVDWIRSKFSVTKDGNTNLAVLHNRNKMVNAFAATEWVAGSDGAVLSRSVTSCAGMTAYLVLLAQTKVGFLSGGRGRSFHQLTPQEQSAQKEEAFTRATVALTRAQQICMIMGPLDMRGLVGAATIMGCLKYGACFIGFGANDQPQLQLLLKDEDLLEAPDDSAFLHSLRISCSRVNGVYPPLALVEAFLTDDDHTLRVRRLHLIIVDLKRRRRLLTRVSKQLLKVKVDECVAQCWNTLPIPCKHDQAAYQMRYVFAYAMDGTDLPCYILWPVRTEDNSFWCIDAWKGDWVQLDKCGYMAPVGIEQFFDAFSLDPKRPWRTAACQALGIPAGHIAEDTHINPSEGSKFTLTPRCIPVERWTIAEKNSADVIMKDGEESGSGADSGLSGVSDNSSTDPEGTILEASSVASDQDRFDAAYEAFRDLSEGLYDIDTRQYARGVTSDDAPGIMLSDGQVKLRELVHLPRNWPLARFRLVGLASK